MGFDTLSRMFVCNVSKFTSRFSYNGQQFMCINCIFSLLDVYQEKPRLTPELENFILVFIRRVLCEILNKVDF